MSNTLSDEAQIAVMAANVENIKSDVGDIKRKLEKDYVSKDSHALVVEKVDRLEKIVYGIIMVVLAGLIGIGMSVFKK